ncbi:MAG: sugar phosphate nucleotidyltransferase [Acidobacteriota bacterium]
MKALILAGGKGTRLRPLTVYTPKPIVPLMNQPFLLFQIEALRKAGITDITLSLSYQPDKIAEIIGAGSAYGVSISYVTEPTPLGTAGAFKFAAKESKDATVVLNGDILTDADIGDIVKRHKNSGAEATIAISPVDDPSKYGLVETGDGGKILRFSEKPSEAYLEQTKCDTVNAGIYVLEPHVLDLIPENEIRSFEYDVFPQMLSSSSNIAAYTLKDSYWRDIGNPASYLSANLDFVLGKVAGLTRPVGGDYEKATAAFVDKNSLIGDGCSIKPGARVVNSVLGSNVTIDEKAVIENSVIWSNSKVSPGSKVFESILGRSCYIGRNVTVSEGSVLGDKTSLTDYTSI